MDRKNQFLANLSSNLLQYALSLGPNFLLVSFMVRRIGIEANGLWILLTALAEYLSLLAIGLSNAFLKFISESRGRADEGETAGLYRFSLFYYRLASLFSLTLGLLLVWGLPSLFTIPQGSLSMARTTLSLLIFEASLNLLLSPGRILLQSFHRFDLINLGLSLKWLIRFLLFLGILFLSPSLPALAAANLSINSVLWLVLAYQGSRLIRFKSHGVTTLLSAQRRRTLLRYTLWVLLSMVANRLFYYIDSLVIGIFRSSREISFYYSAWKIVEIVRGVGLALIPFFLPLASEMEAAKEERKIPLLFFQGMRLITLFTFPMIAYFSVLGDRFLLLWVGPEFLAYYPLIPILLLPQAGILTFLPSSSICFGIDRHRPFILYSLLSSLLNLTVSLLLVKPFGIWGVAWGTTVTLLLCFLFDLFFHPWLIGFPRREYLRILGRGGLFLLLSATLFLPWRGLRSTLLSLVLPLPLFPLGLFLGTLLLYTRREREEMFHWLSGFLLHLLGKGNNSAQRE